METDPFFRPQPDRLAGCLDFISGLLFRREVIASLVCGTIGGAINLYFINNPDTFWWFVGSGAAFGFTASSLTRFGPA